MYIKACFVSFQRPPHLPLHLHKILNQLTAVSGHSLSCMCNIRLVGNCFFNTLQCLVEVPPKCRKLWRLTNKSWECLHVSVKVGCGVSITKLYTDGTIFVPSYVEDVTPSSLGLGYIVPLLLSLGL